MGIFIYHNGQQTGPFTHQEIQTSKLVTASPLRVSSPDPSAPTTTEPSSSGLITPTAPFPSIPSPAK